MRWLSLLLLGCKGTPEPLMPDPCLSVHWETHAEPFVTGWCTGCHSGVLGPEVRGGAPVGIDFDQPVLVAQFAGAMAAISVNSDSSMPPGGGPDLEERTRFSQWVQCDLPGLPEEEVCAGETFEGDLQSSLVPDLCPDTRFVTGSVTLDAPGAECLCAVGGDLEVVAGHVEMPSLRRVRGDLLATDSTATALLLPSLEQVDGRVVIERNPQLSVLDLDGFAMASSVSIRRNSTLPEVDLPRLATVPGPLAITDNEALATVDVHSLLEVGPLDFQNNPGLTWVESPAGLQRLHIVDLSDTPSLSELRGFEGLVEVGSFRIANSGATQLRAFSDTVEIDSLQVVDLPDLDRLRGFASLQRVDGLFRLEALPTLETVSAFENLESVGGPFALISVPLAPMEFPALRSLEGSLRLERIPDLISLQRFSALDALGGLELIGNPGLTSVSGLEGITVTDGGVWLFQNPFLTGLAGLSGLTRIDGDLVVQGNPSLTSMNGLASLTEVTGDLVVQGNIGLDPIELAAWVETLTVGGEVLLE